MSFEPIHTVTSPAVVLTTEHIDTDRIIPARFLTTTTHAGLGEHAFADWRTDPTFPFNDPRAAGASILVAGRNFGCGSSREHAAWALRDLGVRVVISSEIADIFRANAGRNGILPIVVDEDCAASLLANPFAETTVDLEKRVILAESVGEATFDVDPFTRECLMRGVDQLGYLLEQSDAIDAYFAQRDAQEEREAATWNG